MVKHLSNVLRKRKLKKRIVSISFFKHRCTESRQFVIFLLKKPNKQLSSHKCLFPFDSVFQWSQLKLFWIVKNLFKIPAAFFWMTSVINLQLYILAENYFFSGDGRKKEKKSWERYVWEKEIAIYISHIYIVGEEVLFLIKLYLKTDREWKNGGNF